MSVSPRPFRDEDAPGRIPESLIDSVLDGAVDERTRREVARALRHDPRRRAEVSQTLEALGALREPVACPDFAPEVLGSLERRHRFSTPRVRQIVRQTRLGLGMAALLTLAGVAVTQRAVPRLASLGDQPTPVTDVAQAMKTETLDAADKFRDGVRLVQASMPSLVSSLGAPGEEMRMGLEIDSEAANAMSSGRIRVVTLEGGRFIIVEASATCRPGTDGARGLVSSLSITRQGGAASDEPAGADTLP